MRHAPVHVDLTAGLHAVVVELEIVQPYLRRSRRVSDRDRALDLRRTEARFELDARRGASGRECGNRNDDEDRAKNHESRMSSTTVLDGESCLQRDRSRGWMSCRVGLPP